MNGWRAIECLMSSSGSSLQNMCKAANVAVNRSVELSPSECFQASNISTTFHSENDILLISIIANIIRQASKYSDKPIRLHLHYNHWDFIFPIITIDSYKWFNCNIHHGHILGPVWKIYFINEDKVKL